MIISFDYRTKIRAYMLLESELYKYMGLLTTQCVVGNRIKVQEVLRFVFGVVVGSSTTQCVVVSYRNV